MISNIFDFYMQLLVLCMFRFMAKVDDMIYKRGKQGKLTRATNLVVCGSVNGLYNHIYHLTDVVVDNLYGSM